jgi:cyanophycinase
MKHMVMIIFLLGWINALQAQHTLDQGTHGHGKGTLIAIGGGRIGPQIMEEFRKCAGGDRASIVIIPTAMPDEYLERESAFEDIMQMFKSAGFSDITMMHTRDRAEANEEQFIAPLKRATGVFFTGGRQWRIADGFLNTRAHEEMFALLDRGGVIAGTSAGATIQGSFLARGDTQNNQIMAGDHQSGLGFITNAAIDQHLLVRNRQFDMFTILQEHPELLGIGLDENTAIVVRADTLEVIGESYVLIYDRSFWSREGSELKNLPAPDALFYALRQGDRYHLAEREVIAD